MDNSTPKKRIIFDNMKLMEWLICIVFLLIVILLIAGFFPISHPAITRYVRSIIEKSDIDTCSIGRISLTPWKGVTFYDVIAGGVTNNNTEYNLHFSKIRINLNVIRSFTKWPQIKLSFMQLRKSVHNNFAEDFSGTLDMLLSYSDQVQDVKSIIINGKQLKIQRNDTLVLTANRFSFDINRNKEEPQTLEIALEAAEFDYQKFIVTFFKSSAVYNNRTLKINNCRGRIFDGKFRLDSELNLRDNFLVALSLMASKIDIDQIADLAETRYGCYYGEMDFHLNFQPSFLNLDSLRGKGSINASNVKIEDSPVQKSLVELFNIDKLTELSFDRVKSDFKIVNKDTINSEISANGRSIDLKSNGYFNLYGMIDQNIDATLSEEFAKELPDFVAKSLETGEDNRLNVRCKVYGTIDNPKVELDREIMKRTIGNVFEEMKENFKDFFRKK